MKKNILIAVGLVFVILLSALIIHTPSALQVDAVTSATGPTPTPGAGSGSGTSKTTTVSASDGQVYVVVEGDVLWKIAKKFSLTLDQLLQLNPQIKNRNAIYVGQKIIVAANPAAGTVAPAVKSENGNIKLYTGLGHAVAFRNGPGKDDQGVPVYSFTVVMADATFDANGRILSANIDAYEVATPNYDGESMPHFSGWPGTEGYNVTDHATAKVTGKSENTPELAASEVNSWKTKRERGDGYDMNPNNEWYKQMNFYQQFFVGKTIAELKEWFAKNTTAAGRPIKETTTKEDELAKLNKLTAEERAALAEVVSGATMSLSDAHGDFLGALENAYNNRVEVVIPVQ